MNIHNLQRTQTCIDKVIELYETHHSRHSVMLVGKTLSGKSTTWKLFKNALTTLNTNGFNEFNKVIVRNNIEFYECLSTSLFLFSYIQEYPINPKAVSLGELYGQFNLTSNEWNDGILSMIMRQVCSGSNCI